MKLLAIDTSTEQASVALAINGELRVDYQLGVRQHAQYLLPMIERLLAQAGVSCKALDGIVFGTGPGSFTGLRIACSLAKSMAFAHDLPMYPVSSLDSIAYEVSLNKLSNHQGLLAMIDARMQEVYWAYYPPSSVFQSVTPAVSPVEAIHLPDDRDLILAGVGFEAYLGALKANIAQSHTIYPDAKIMLQYVQTQAVESVSASSAEPLYVRNNVVSGVTHG